LEALVGTLPKKKKLLIGLMDRVMLAYAGYLGLLAVGSALVVDAIVIV
jgi:hypothetical protein